MNAYDFKQKIRHIKWIDALLKKSTENNYIHAAVFSIVRHLHIDDRSRVPAVIKSKAYFDTQKERIEEICRLMADKKSKQCFLEQIRYRTGKIIVLKPMTPDEYFPDFVHLSDQEVFVDCGAFTGDTIKNFQTKCNGRYKRIVALEPSPSTFEKLQNNHFERCVCFNYGAWDKAEKLTFLAESSIGDKIASPPPCGAISITTPLKYKRKPSIIYPNVPTLHF